jgi:hypothetical protein
MITNSTNRNSPGAKARAFDESFDSFVPSRDQRALREASASGTALRHAMIGQWLDGLPYAVRPYHLIARMERVALVLIERWDHPSGVVAYIDGLLHDDDAVRTWFTPELIAELMRLASYLRAMRAH